MNWEELMSMLREAPIGVFDSGIGGLTVAREIMRQIPKERIVYFGDTARFFQDMEECCGKEETERLKKGLPSVIRMDCTYYPEINEWRGQKTMQIVVKNYRFNCGSSQKQTKNTGTYAEHRR